MDNTNPSPAGGEPAKAEEKEAAQPSESAESIARDRNLKDLTRLWKNHGCPVCGVDDQWRIGDLGDIPLRNVESEELGTVTTARKVFSVFAIFCANCGYSHFINQRVLRRSIARLDAEEAAPEPDQAKPNGGGDAE